VQKWSTFLRNHAAQVSACDFLQVTDLFFRPLFAFFVVELKSRKVIHVGVTRSPTDAWVAQQLREATPYGHAPKYLIRDNDSKFGPCFARVATTSTIKILKTPVQAPRANAICERFAQERQTRMPGPSADPARKAAPARAKSRMWSTSSRHDPIKGLRNGSLNRADQLFLLIKQAIR
jgi:hypothetical protein